MKRIQLFLILFLLSGCQAANSKNEATNTTGDNEGSQQKMTLPADDQDALRIGVSVKVSGLPKEQGLNVAKAFEAQLPRFETCLKAGKSEIAKLDASWKMGKDGLLSEVKVLKVVPENKIFQDCVVKQLKLLEFKETQVGYGEVTLGTYWGRKGDWNPGASGEQRRFEKGK